MSTSYRLSTTSTEFTLFLRHCMFWWTMVNVLSSKRGTFTLGSWFIERVAHRRRLVFSFPLIAVLSSAVNLLLLLFTASRVAVRSATPVS